MRRDLKTQALVLRRTKYGETDRILSLLTPEGKIDVLARGVRKEKSRLAGGVEMFCLSEVMIHQHRADQGQGRGLATLTSARMVKFYQGILTDLGKLELASAVLKGVAQVAQATGGGMDDGGGTGGGAVTDGERAAGGASDVKNLTQIPDGGGFQLLKQIFEGLQVGYNLTMVETYYLLNLAKLSGEEPNLYYDTNGEKLQGDRTYIWNVGEEALEATAGGTIGNLTPREMRTSDLQGVIRANEIKLMRLCLTVPLATVAKVQGVENVWPQLLSIAKAVNKL